MRRIIVPLLGTALFCAIAVVLAQPASAHATVVGSQPAAGAQLRTAPAYVEIVFDEPVGIAGVGYVHVVDATGRRVDRGDPVHPGGDGSRVQVALVPDLQPGQYAEYFRVISADSHPITGAIGFAVGHAGRPLAVAPAAPQVTNRATGLAFDLARWISFTGLVLLGGGWITGTVWRAGRREPRTRALAQSGAWALTIGTVLELLLQGPYSAGLGPGHLSDPALLRDTLNSVFGAAHLWRLGLVAASSYLLWTPRRPRPWLASGGVALLGAAIAVTFAASGHAWSEHPRWLALLSDSLHVLSMSVWLGGLVFLLTVVFPLRDPGVVRAVLPMYSRVAFACVVVLATTGTYQAVRTTVSMDALLHTRYGQLVLGKVALFVLMVGLGNVSRALVLRRYLQPSARARTWAGRDARRGAAAPHRHPGRTVLAESFVGAAVLVVTAVLVAQPPGSVALAGRRAAAHSASVALGGGRSARVTVTPGHHGPATITVAVTGAQAPQHIAASAVLASRGIGPIAVPLTRTGPLTYAATGVLLPAAGLWTVDLTVQTSTFDATTASVAVRLY